MTNRRLRNKQKEAIRNQYKELFQTIWGSYPDLSEPITPEWILVEFNVPDDELEHYNNHPKISDQSLYMGGSHLLYVVNGEPKSQIVFRFKDDTSWINKVATLLHELGHAHDLKRRFHTGELVVDGGKAILYPSTIGSEFSLKDMEFEAWKFSYDEAVKNGYTEVVSLMTKAIEDFSICDSPLYRDLAKEVIQHIAAQNP